MARLQTELAAADAELEAAVVARDREQEDAHLANRVYAKEQREAEDREIAEKKAQERDVGGSQSES